MTRRKREYIFMALLFIAVTVYVLLRGSAVIILDFGEDSLTVTGPEDYSFTVAYADFASVELLTPVDFGERLSGGEKGGVSWGRYRSEELGEYELCVTSKADSCIVLGTTGGECYVFSYENDDSTRQVYEHFCLPILENGRLG